MATTTKASGNISIIWGTANGINSPSGLAGMILESLTFTPKNADAIDIENGDGLAAIQVFVEDGGDFKATGLYDSNRALPAAGANVVIVLPKSDGNAGTSNVNATFWSYGFSRGRKKEATVELNLTRRPTIDG
jgi:hypothetical protein